MDDGNGPRRRPARAGVLLMLALRNLRRHLRRTVLTGAAMAVGGALMTVAFALGDGSHERWIESGVRVDAGHVTVEHPGFRLSRLIDDRLPAEARRAAEEAMASPAVADRVLARSSKLTIDGLAVAAAVARPARIVAVDPASEAEFSTVDEQVVDGRYLAPDDRLAAYVAVGLAARLGLRLGSRMVVQAQDAEGGIAGQLLRVVGIFRTGVPDVDQVLVHIPLAAAAEWLGTGDDVTSVGVVVDDSATVDRVAGHLRRALADPIARGGARVVTWRESNPALASAIALDDLGNHMIYGILFTIIAFGVVNTVLMSVLSRRREFGVLHALGLTPGQTGAIVLVEGLTLTTASGLLGVGAAMFVLAYFFGDGIDFTALTGEDMTFSGVVIDPVVVPLFRVTRVARIFAFLVVLGTVASILPALRAARTDAGAAMKFDR